jgi:hypothetical protein
MNFWLWEFWMGGVFVGTSLAFGMYRIALGWSEGWYWTLGILGIGLGQTLFAARGVRQCRNKEQGAW